MDNFTINRTLKSNLPDTIDGNEIHFTEDGEIYISNKEGKLVKTGIDNELINKINVLKYQELPDSITSLTELTDYNKWVCKGNAQAVNITDLPIAGKSFSVENIPTVFSADGTASKSYCLQRVIFYQDAQGTYERRKTLGTWGAWKRTDTDVKTLIANGVFRGGETITLSEPITNFNKLTFFFGDAGGSPNHAETATIIPYIHPNNFTADNNITYAGYGYNGIWKITTKESGTKLEVTTLGSSYVRKVFGIKEG